MPVKPLEQLSFDTQRALEQFSSAFESAFAAVEAANFWAYQFGHVETSDQLLLTYPMSISAAGYKERRGDDAARDMYERAISVTPTVWVDGVKAQKERLRQRDFATQAWAGEAARIAVEGRRHANILAARMLHSNPNLQLYKDATLGIDAGIPLFSDSHQANIFDTAVGTYKNVLLGGGTDFAGGAIDAAMMKAVLQHGRTGIKSPNGTPRPVVYSHMLVHPEHEQAAKDFLESDLIRTTILEGGVGPNTNLNTNNRFKNLIKLVVCDELAQVPGVDEDKIYFIDAGNGAKPWILQDSGSPEENMFDESSEFCKNTGMVKVTYAMRMAVTAALPQAILRVDLTP